MMDYYKVLGIEINASKEEIKKAYVTLAKKFHPDVTTLPKDVAERKMSAINEAYAILSDANKRSCYDSNGMTVQGVYAYDNSVAYALANKVLLQQCQRAEAALLGVGPEVLPKLWLEFGEDTFYTYHRLKEVKSLQDDTKEAYKLCLKSFEQALWAEGLLSLLNEARQQLEQAQNKKGKTKSQTNRYGKSSFKYFS